MNAFFDFVGALLGSSVAPKDLTLLQVSLRGIIVFVATLIMVRLGHKRSLARKTAFDAALLVILASVLSRAVNGSAPFWPTMGVGFVLVFLHRIFALIAYHWHWFGILIKGRPELIVEDGNLILGTMRRNHISAHDVEEDLRLSGKSEKIDNVRAARVERSGDISFLT